MQDRAIALASLARVDELPDLVQVEL